MYINTESSRMWKHRAWVCLATFLMALYFKNWYQLLPLISHNLNHHQCLPAHYTTLKPLSTLLNPIPTTTNLILSSLSKQPPKLVFPPNTTLQPDDSSKISSSSMDFFKKQKQKQKPTEALAIKKKIDKLNITISNFCSKDVINWRKEQSKVEKDFCIIHD